MVVIHSLSNVFTSLNSTAPAKLGAGGLAQPDGSGCKPEGPGTPELEAECSPCYENKWLKNAIFTQQHILRCAKGSKFKKHKNYQRFLISRTFMFQKPIDQLLGIPAGPWQSFCGTTKQSAFQRTLNLLGGTDGIFLLVSFLFFHCCWF